MSKHKHAEVIKAWADGAEIECRQIGDRWTPCGTRPNWYDENEYRVKPAKLAKSYPATQMTIDELIETWNTTTGALKAESARIIANAAIRHACDSGQLVPIWDVMAEVDRVAGESRAARDMAISEAVRDSAINAVGGSHIGKLDLASIIAQVKP